MKHHATLLGVLVSAASLAGSSCGGSHAVVAPNDSADAATVAAAPGLVQALGAQRGGKIWADCRLFGTVGTPAHFRPGKGPFDELYNIGPAGGAFKNGVTAISESKPGDQDFNGGRWHVNVLKEGVDNSKYSNACSVEDLDPADFMDSGIYFECPLLPRH